MKADADFYVHAIVSVLVITDPVTRGIFFKTMTEHEPERRVEYVRRITIAVGITLGVAAVAGREILELLGINLGAFGIAGGLIVAGAITLVITIASSTSNGEGTIAALVAVAVAVVLLPIGHLLISNHVKLSEAAIGIATKFGGLLIATIGIQLMLNGIKTFFALG